MSRALTRRRHGKHRSFDRSRKPANDSNAFYDAQAARLNAVEGDQGIHDTMHLVQGEAESFTFEQVQAATDASDIGLFVAQTQSLSLDITEFLLNSTNQAIGVAGDWTMLVWAKPANVVGTHHLAEVLGSGGNRMNYNQSSDIGQIVVEDVSGTPSQQTGWLNAFQDANWHQFGATWSNGGPLMENYRDGVNLGAPDSGTVTPAVTMTDTNRSVAFGARTNGTLGFEGLIAQLALFRVVLTSAQILATYNAGNGSVFNLNQNSGNYGQAGDLAHWWRAGHEAVPNLGKDFSEAGFTPTIDIGVNAVGLDDADRTADVPT